jgi:hypothetical protein
MPSTAFDAAFKAALLTLAADAAAAGISMSEVCKAAGASRATPHRYLKRPPETVKTVAKLQNALAKLIAEKSAQA